MNSLRWILALLILLWIGYATLSMKADTLQNPDCRGWDGIDATAMLNYADSVLRNDNSTEYQRLYADEIFKTVLGWTGYLAAEPTVFPEGDETVLMWAGEYAVYLMIGSGELGTQDFEITCHLITVALPQVLIDKIQGLGA